MLLLCALATLLLVIRAYRDQSNQHALELQKQQAHFASTASDEKKRHDNFTKPLNYDNRGIV
jgi:hypothetical protein